MSRPIHVAVLDSGLRSDERAELGEIREAWKGSFDSYEDRTGHGTTCARLIRKAAPSAHLYIVKIFDITGATSPELVLQGLQWCIDNGMDVVNVSVAVPEVGYYHEFADICRRAASHNITIVSAADNMGRPCLPAYCETVIGVGGAHVREAMILHRPGHPIEFYASPEGNDPRGGGQGSSYATARISGLIAKTLSSFESRDIAVIRAIVAHGGLPYDHNAQPLAEYADCDLVRMATPIIHRSYLADAIGQFGSSVLYGSQLDVDLFSEHRRHLRFPVAGLFGSRSQPPLLSHLTISGDPRERVIDALDEAETLIVGHVAADSADASAVLTAACERDRNIFWLRKPQRPANGNGLASTRGWTKWAGGDESTLLAWLENIPPGHISKALLPVLAVVHIGRPRIGQFRIELMIRDAFRRAGHNIAQIGSVPYAELFGCQYSHWSACLPESCPPGIRVALGKALAESSDHATVGAQLLIVGCEAGLAPSTFGTGTFFHSYSIPILAFLFGMQPDAALVVVDDLTDANVLCRNINALRSLLGTAVIGIVHDSALREYALALGTAPREARRNAVCERCALMARAERLPTFCAVSTESFATGVAEAVRDYFHLDWRNKDGRRTQ